MTGPYDYKGYLLSFSRRRAPFFAQVGTTTAPTPKTSMSGGREEKKIDGTDLAVS